MQGRHTANAADAPMLPGLKQQNHVPNAQGMGGRGLSSRQGRRLHANWCVLALCE